MQKEDQTQLQILLDDVDNLALTNEAKALIKEVLQHGTKLDPGSVIRIWRNANNAHIQGLSASIIWLEEGNDRAGLKHIIGQHKLDFENKDIPEDQLAEVAEAATTVGHLVKYQDKKFSRPILILYFYSKPLAVAITVGLNGFVVGMNPQNFEAMRAASGLTEDELKEIASWPEFVQ